MRTRALFIVLALGAILAGSRTGAAQTLEQPRPRQGYYLALGGHAALYHHREEGQGVGPWMGYATTLRLGQLVTRRLGLGFRFDYGGAAAEEQEELLVGISLEGQVRLVDNLALHVGTGLGVVELSYTTQENEDLRGAFGGIFSVGLTYDWFVWPRRPSGGLALTPGARFAVIPGETTNAFILLMGVEVTYWTGLPRNQLELSEEEAYRRGK